MKYFLTITFTLFALFLVAQSGTTLDEYRYLSKGYAYQVEMGLDPAKNGYEIRQNYRAEDKTTVMGLYQMDHQELKGLLVVAVDEKGKPHYLVMPNPQSDPKVLQMYKQDLQQYKHQKIYAKIRQAKDEYLFGLATGHAPSSWSPSKSTNTSDISKSTVSPTAYDALPAPRKEKFTAKGGTSLPTGKDVNALSGKTVTGQLNAELKDRTVLIFPYAQNTSPAKGKVMVKFCVNAAGVVTYAKFTQRGSTTHNAQLKALALAAVRKMRLASSDNEEACGTVGFEF